MITQERLRELLEYNPDTGIAFWRAGQRKGRRAGTVQRSKRSKPYRRVGLVEGWKNKRNLSHVAIFYVTGKWPANEVDHKNGDTLDDRWENLRESTRAQNEANRGPRKNNKLGLKGVRQVGNRYCAEIYRLGDHRYLGTFDTPQEAHEAYLAEASKFDGEFLRAA